MARFFRDTLLFHHHIRIGRKGKPIVVSKIRTMKRGSYLDRQKVLGFDFTQVARYRTADRRVTRVGAWLRKWHLDELPQLVNFLKGDFRPIGMRPLLRSDYQKLPLEVKEMYDDVGPGLVGILYACERFPPSTRGALDEFKRFYHLWKRNRTKAYWTYAKRIVKNKLLGKANSV